MSLNIGQGENVVTVHEDKTRVRRVAIQSLGRPATRLIVVRYVKTSAVVIVNHFCYSVDDVVDIGFAHPRINRQ
jgi:hypothetical protein